MKCIPVAGVLLCFFLALPVRADVYRYTDGAGALHFVDDIAKVPKKYRDQLDHAPPLPDITVMDAAPATSPPSVAGSQRRPRRESPRLREVSSTGSDQVEVFMTSWCGYCKKMVRFLTEKGIPFTTYDIENDPVAARTYRELGGRGVPVVRVGKHVVYGYNPKAVISFINGEQ